jgi:hypothetical protein
MSECKTSMLALIQVDNDVLDDIETLELPPSLQAAADSLKAPAS